MIRGLAGNETNSGDCRGRIGDDSRGVFWRCRLRGGWGLSEVLKLDSLRWGAKFDGSLNQSSATPSSESHSDIKMDVLKSKTSQ